jgi:hypothetical protein
MMGINKKRNDIIYKIKSMAMIDNQVLSQLFLAHAGDVLGYKEIFLFSPILEKLRAYLPNYIKLLLDKEEERFCLKDFDKWLIDFEERLVSHEFLHGVNVNKIWINRELNVLMSLSNLDLIYLRGFFKDMHFDQMLFRHLPLQRINIIFKEEKEKSSLFQIYRNFDQLEDIEITHFYQRFLEKKESLQNIYLPQIERDFFLKLLDSRSREYIINKLTEKSILELCYIMLELNKRYRLILSELLPDVVKGDLLPLIFGNNIILKDETFLSKFIKEIKKDYYKGVFTLSSDVY